MTIAMFKKALATLGIVVAAIIIFSVVNDLLTYRIDRTAGVDFGKYHEYSGVVGIRTRYSDGSGTYQQIGRMCDSLGIHFAVITDRNTVQPMLDGLANRFGMSLIIPAVEISTDKEHGHFLVIGDSVPVMPHGRVTPDSTVDDASKKKGIIILGDISTQEKPVYSSTENFTGIEFYDFDKNWRNSLNFFRLNKIIAAYIIYGFQDEAINYLLEYPAREMEIFDSLNTRRKVVGIDNIDAHSNVKLGKNLYWHFPSYQSLLNLVHTDIVTREPFNGLYHHDRELVLNAIRDGHMFASFSGLENARGFLFTAIADTTEAIMGDSLKADKSACLHVLIPDSDNVLTEILRNGKIVGSFDNVSSIDLPVVLPGEYRVQAFQRRTMLPLFMKRPFPWILSNPIYIYR